jgi:hypothetical protein
MTLVLLAGLILSAGCGEKEEPEPPSAEATISAGDEICAAAQQEVDRLRTEQPRSAREAAELTEGVIAAFEREIAELEAIEAPDQLAEDLDRYIAAREEALEPLRRGLRAARGSNERAYARAQADAASGQVERTRLARAVGFRRCSRPAGPDLTPG